MRKAELNPIEFEASSPRKRQILGLEFYCFIRLAGALVCFIIGLFFRAGSFGQMLFMLMSFLLAAYDVVMATVEEVSEHRSLTMEPLVLLASLAAFVFRLEVDGAALMFLFRICSILLDYAVFRSEKTMKDAVDTRPVTVSIIEDELVSTVERDAVRPGDMVLLSEGMISPVDCLVAEGHASIDCSALTGNHHAQNVGEGDTVLAGAKLLTGEVKAEAIGPASASMIERAWNESRSAGAEEGKTEQWAELYRKYFAPVALALGAVVTVLLNLIGKCSVSNAFHRALCVVILMNPAGLFAGLSVTAHMGISGALSRGVLFKGVGALEKMSGPVTVVLDKNGTVTTGKYRIDGVNAMKLSPEILLKAAAHAAANAGTPMAEAVLKGYNGKVDYSIISNFVEFTNGLSVDIEGVHILMGTHDFLKERNVALPDEKEDELELLVAFAGFFAGSIHFAEMPRASVNDTVDELNAAGCEDIVLLSEDNSEKTHALARSCGIEKFYANCGKPEKLARLNEICSRSGKSTTAFVGGANCDTDCLDAADAGVILGDLDNKSAEHAQVLLMSGDLQTLCEAVRSAMLTRKVYLQGVAAVLGVKLLLILLALFGVSSQLWFDMLVDGCVAIGAVLNSIRAFPVSPRQ